MLLVHLGISGVVSLLCLFGQAIATSPDGSNDEVNVSPSGNPESSSNSPSSLVSLATTSGNSSDSGTSPPSTTGNAQSYCYRYLTETVGCAVPTPKNPCPPKVANNSAQWFGSEGIESNGSTAPKPSKKLATSENSGSGSEISLAVKNDPEPASSTNLTGSLTSLVGKDPTVLGPAFHTSSFSLDYMKVSYDSTTGERGPKLGPNGVITADGVCGPYNTDSEIGVCLWGGEDSTGKAPTTSGWLNSAVLRVGSRDRIIAKVVDSCTFKLIQGNASLACNQIFLTRKAFMALNPSPKEIQRGFFIDDQLVWDFFSRTNSSNAAI